MNPAKHAQTQAEAPVMVSTEPDHPVVGDGPSGIPVSAAVQNGDNDGPPDSMAADIPPAQVEVANAPVTGNVPVAPDSDAKRIANLAALKPLDYDRLRREEAKALGVQVKTLDDLVKAARNEHSDTPLLPFTEVDSHSDPVVPAEVLDEVSEIICRYIVLDQVQAHAAALWVASTYLTDVAEIAPILIINAPEKECAKTLLQTVLGRMAYRPLPAANASLSALFRAVELWKPTLLIDEADTFFRDNPELHGLVNAGYKRGGSVLRSEAAADSFEPRVFSVYCAKSIAGIALEKHLPDSTMSRGIVLNLRRKLPHEAVLRLRHADNGMFELVAAKLTRFAEDYSQQARLARPPLPDELNDRAQDNWEPLLAIAECAGPDWLKRATAAALKLSNTSDQAVSTGNQLLADIQAVFAGRLATQGPKISTVELIEALAEDAERPWATYNHGKQLSPRQLAKQLTIYGIGSKTVRLDTGKTPKGYEFSQFEDAFARYLAGPPNLPPQRNAPPAAISGIAGPVADRPPGCRNDPGPPEPMPGLDCGGVADVADKTPDSRTNDPDAGFEDPF